MFWGKEATLGDSIGFLHGLSLLSAETNGSFKQITVAARSAVNRERSVHVSEHWMLIMNVYDWSIWLQSPADRRHLLIAPAKYKRGVKSYVSFPP